MGNFEINYEKQYVRLKVNETEYEYIVSKDQHGDQAKKVLRIFEYAYNRGQSDLRRNLRGLLGA